MDRIYQGIGTGSYLDAERVDRLVDHLVRTLNGGLLASALAPTFKVPNSYMKENGSLLILRAFQNTAQRVLGVLPVAARLAHAAYFNPKDREFTSSLVDLEDSTFAVRWSRALRVQPKGSFGTSIDAAVGSSGAPALSAFPGSWGPDGLDLCVAYYAEHIT